jgi:biopolymer transport protein ExbD
MRIHDQPPRRSRVEPLLPMIDVVFFLVVFFMIVSRLAAPEPFAVARPAAAGAEETMGEFSLFLSATGVLGFVGPDGSAEGEAVLPALIAARAAYCGREDCAALPPVLLFHADAAAPAAKLAEVLPALKAAGFAEVSLLTVAK